MAAVCAGCSHNYWKFIKEFYLDDEAAVQFLRSHGVLPSEVQCPRCKAPCHYREDRHSWYCGRWKKIAKTKRRKQCNFTTSEYKGTFLEGTHLKPSEIVCFVNHWLRKKWDHDTFLKCLNWAHNTIVNWQSACFEVTEWWFDNQDSVGGEGIEVEIDETLFVKSKYDSDRTLSQVRIFGGIERISKKCFIAPFFDEDRSAATLVPIIKQYIKPGSVIYSDSWYAYSKLCDEGYMHYMIDPENQSNPNAHIENIERLWSGFEQWKNQPGLRSKYFKQYFARYMFLHIFKEEQVQHHFFSEAARLYRPQSDKQRPVSLPFIPQLLKGESDSDSDSGHDGAAAAPTPEPSTSHS